MSSVGKWQWMSVCGDKRYSFSFATQNPKCNRIGRMLFAMHSLYAIWNSDTFCDLLLYSFHILISISGLIPLFVLHYCHAKANNATISGERFIHDEVSYIAGKCLTVIRCPNISQAHSNCPPSIHLTCGHATICIRTPEEAKLPVCTAR